MPQELQVVRCYSCETFQVDIVKKVPKWTCKMCGEKQSLKKIYGKGTGIDCRKVVQELNQQRIVLRQIDVETTVCDDADQRLSQWTQCTTKETNTAEREENNILTDDNVENGSKASSDHFDNSPRKIKRSKIKCDVTMDGVAEDDYHENDKLIDSNSTRKNLEEISLCKTENVTGKKQRQDLCSNGVMNESKWSKYFQYRQNVDDQNFSKSEGSLNVEIENSCVNLCGNRYVFDQDKPTNIFDDVDENVDFDL